MESPYKSPAPLVPDPPQSSGRNFSFLSWWGIIPALAFFAVEAVVGWPAARAERANVTDAISVFVGHVAAGVLIPALVAWIVYRFAGRSQFFSTMAFGLTTALMCASVIRGSAMRAANTAGAPTPISVDDFRFEIPQGWQRAESDREKTKGLLVRPAAGGVAGMIQVDVGKPSLPTARDVAKSLAGSDGSVLPDAVALDGVAGFRLRTPSTDLTRPCAAVVVFRNGRVYLIMAAT